MVREQKAHREQEQERQWKQLQVMRQQQAQQQQFVLQEQRAQALPTQQPHPLPVMVRVQQQMMNGEPVIKSPTSCGSITPTTPSSPSQIDQFGSSHSITPISGDSFGSSALQSHSTLMSENTVQQVKMTGPDQLHGAVVVNPLSPNVQQTVAISRTPGPFTPPIQVSRVRPPIDTSQVHVNMRMPSNDPYAQMPGTPRPSNINPIMESFNRPLSHHSPMSPQIIRSPVRIQDSFVRQSFAPRGPSVNEGFSGPGQNIVASKPHLGVDMYSKSPLVVASRPQNRDTVSPATPRTPDVFHTPPSTPHTPNQDSFQNVSTASEAFNQQPIVSSNHSVSPFSPSHSSHGHMHSQDQYNHLSPHTPRTSDPYSQQPTTPRADPYAQQPATPRADPYAQQPATPRADQYAQQPATPRVDPYAQQPATPRADPYAQQPPTPRPTMQQMSEVFAMQTQSRVVMSPVTRPNQMQQSDAFGQSPRPNDQFQMGGEPRQRPKMSPITVHYSSASEQPSQSMEHYNQPRTPGTPRLNPSPIEEPYAQSPMTPRPLNSPSAACSRSSHIEQFSLDMELGVNQGGNSTALDQDPNQQLARQQLRDILQKQQNRKQEQIASQGQLPLRHWPLDQGQENESNQNVVHPVLQECIRMPGAHIIRQQLPDMPRPVMSPNDNSFRLPYPPGVRPRHPLGTSSPGPHQISQQLHGQPQALMNQMNQFRHPGQVLESRPQGPNVGDPQMRLTILQQQQRLAHASQLRSLNPNRLQLNIQGPEGSNSMDTYNHIIQQQRLAQNQQQQLPPLASNQQQQQQMSPLTPNQMRMFAYQPNSGMRQTFITSQQQMQSPQQRMVIPTSTSQPVIDYGTANLPIDTIPQQQLCGVNDQQCITGVMRPGMQISSSSSMVMSGDNLLHSELGGEVPHESSIPGVPLEGDPSTADKVAEELQRIEKESSGDLQTKLEDPEDDLDDDELLGLGNDFNILEYADPELDKDIVGDGKKTNILDENLDLDDKDEDLEDDEVKTKVDSPGDRVTDIKVEMEGNTDQHMDIASKEESLDDLNKQGSSSGLGLGKSDFQAKFLEFSQKRELEKAEELKSDIFEEENIDLNSSNKSGELDIKPNVKMELNMGEMLHNMPSASFSSVTAILPENPVPSTITPSTMCQMPNIPSNQMYMSHEGVGNQMIVIQRPIRPQFSQQLMHGPPELRHQVIGPRQQHPGMKILQPPPPPYPVGRPPPPYQPVRGQALPSQQMAARGTYNSMMIGFRSQQPGQMQPHNLPLSMNPAVRQTQAQEPRLLLADLLEQEKLELKRQQQQQQHSNLLTHTHSDGLALSDLDFEKLKEDVFAAGGSSLSPPGSGIPTQNLHLSPHKEQSPSHSGQVLSPSLGMEHDNPTPMIGRPVQAQPLQQTLGGQLVGLHHQSSQAPPAQMPLLLPPPPRHNNPMMDTGVHPALMQGGRPPLPITSIPPPQAPPAEVVTESDRQAQANYEHWLFQQQHVITTQLKYFESEVGKLRKARKSLNTKKRNLAKTGGQLSETDSVELERITREQTSLQKQLEQVRKQSRQHQLIMQEYHTKQQKQQQQSPQQMMSSQQMPMQLSPHSSAVQSPMLNGPSTPMSPLMSPSPIGPSHSPLRQQSPSPMMQHSPLASSHSPLVQHPSPLGQQVFHQQASPRHANPNLNMEQPSMRQSGIQSSPLQEDNNPFSDNFQHRELRPSCLGPRPPHIGFQDDIEDRKPFRDQSCSPNAIQRWNQPNRGICPSDQNIKLVPRGFHSSMGPRMMIPTSSDQIQQQVLYQQQSVSSSTGSFENEMSHCLSGGLQSRLSPTVQSPTHYQLQSPNCSLPDRNPASSLGSCIQTSSPSISTGNSIETSISSLVQSSAESFNLSSQPQVIPIMNRVNESASAVGSRQVNQETIATSLGMLLNDNSTPVKRVFTNSVGPNSDRVARVMQSGSEESSGSSELNIENDGSCVGVSRVPLRKPTSIEHLSSTSSTTVDCLQTGGTLATLERLEMHTKKQTDSDSYDTSNDDFILDQPKLLNSSGEVKLMNLKIKVEKIDVNETNLNAICSSVNCGYATGVNMRNMNETCNQPNYGDENLESTNCKSQNLIDDAASVDSEHNSQDCAQSVSNSVSGSNNGSESPDENNPNKDKHGKNPNNFGGRNPHSRGENGGNSPRGSGGGTGGSSHHGSTSGNNSNVSNSSGNGNSGASEENNQQSSGGSSSGGNNPNDGNDPPNRNPGGNAADNPNEEQDDGDDDDDDEENEKQSSNNHSNIVRSTDGFVNRPTIPNTINQPMSNPQEVQSIQSNLISNLNLRNLIASFPTRVTETVSSTSSNPSNWSHGVFFRISGDNNTVTSSVSNSAVIRNPTTINNPNRDGELEVPSTIFSNPTRSGNHGANEKFTGSSDSGPSRLNETAERRVAAANSGTISLLEGDTNAQVSSSDYTASGKLVAHSSKSPGLGSNFKCDKRVSSTNVAVPKSSEIRPKSDDLVTSTLLEVDTRTVKLENPVEGDGRAESNRRLSGPAIDSTTTPGTSRGDEGKLNFASSESFKRLITKQEPEQSPRTQFIQQIIKTESAVSTTSSDCSGSSTLGFSKPQFPMTQTRPCEPSYRMPLHMTDNWSLATQLSARLDVLTGSHPQPFPAVGRGLSRGHQVPTVQPRFTDQSNSSKLSLTSTSISSAVTSGVPRVSQVGLPNPMSGRGQAVTNFTQSPIAENSQETSSILGTNEETKVDSGTGVRCQVVIKQEISTSGSSGETSGECLLKLAKVEQPPSCSKIVKEKRLFNFSAAAGSLESVTKPETKLVSSDGHESSIPQNALLKQLLQTSQSSPQFPKKQEKPEPVPPPLPPPPPIYDTAAEVIASVAQLPPSPEHSHSSSECGLTEEERNRISLDELAMKLSNETDGMAKGKRSKGAQTKRQPKQKQSKEGGLPAKKRARKGSNPKPEEDYDGFMDTLRVQLLNLPSLRILEPDIQPNFNVCPTYGSRHLSSSSCKLSGNFGRCTFSDKIEFYLENPNSATIIPPPTPPPQRGFYIQEFPSRYFFVAPLDEQRLAVGPDIRRSVDIPGSILTPPPCINDKPPRDFNSPDLILSSSSPECSLLEPPCRYPYLQLIEDDESAVNTDINKSASPHVPLYFPIPIRARPSSRAEKRSSFDFDDEDPSLKDKENIIIGDNKAEKEALLIRSKLGFRPPVPLKDSANVSVTLTLTSSAAEDIRGVLSAVADLLKIPAPVSFEITERTVTPPSQKMGLYKRGKDPTASIQSLFNGQPKFCRHCDVVVMNAGIKKKWSEMSFVNKDEQEEDEVMFCSSSCYMQFALSHRSGSQITEKEVAAVVDHLCNVLSPSQSRMKTKSTSSGKSSPLSESSKDEMKNEDSQGSNKITPETIRDAFEPVKDACVTAGSKRKDSFGSSKESLSATLGKSLRRHNEQRTTEHDHSDEPVVKKWKGIKWKRWTTDSVPRPTYTKPSENEINAMLDKLDVCIKPKNLPIDSRSCVLCQEVGDGATNGAARLLNIDVDKWVHLNCALWSSEVYETVNGALMNVDLALKRGFGLDCIVCKRKGATLGCFRVRCTSIYHFTCAIKDKCMFFKDKTVFCPLHIPKQMPPELKDNELHNLSVSRRVYVNRDENKQVASMMHRGDCCYLLRVGNLVFLSIGQLLPHQLQAFHSRNFIYPVGYKIIRMYWSLRNIGKRCQYICSIQDNEGKPEFHIQIKESGYSDLFMHARTARGVWQQIIEPIDKMRREANAIKVFTAFITGEDLFGLNEPSILRVLESLPGVETLSDYHFKYGRSPLLDLPLAINPTGSARSEPKLRTHYRRPHTLHTSSSSRSSFQVAITGLETTCPYSKQFIHSKAFQYRKMKVEWRNNVYLARSRIQGLGLYAAREIEKHTMVIEYLGELIRNEVAEKRERYYEAQNRGIYMFRLDDGRVIDASLTGGLARYINHSCNPNCVAEVVQIDREYRIIIFACRRIARGEELCYDYKFDIEDDQHKIPCLCGAPNCKKWMN
ncbi:hypothetical protein CHUAL_010262 [Chamberlinius hualienensis]